MRFPIALLSIALTSVLGSVALAADTMATSPTIVSGANIKWMDGTGSLKGAKVAVLMGDMSKPGPLVWRIKMPAGMTVAPHYHPGIENVTVLSGTFVVGLGDTVDRAKAVVLPAGSFVSVPANAHHWAMAKTESIVQLNSDGPFGMTAVTK